MPAMLVYWGDTFHNVPRYGRDLLRPVFLTRSGGMQMEAGELSEAEVELEVVEPWDTRVNMFGA
jgi:hypothetical protein